MMLNKSQCSSNKSACSFINSSALVLASIGAVNWGLVGILELDLVDFLFSSFPRVKTLTYSLVGIGGIVLLWNHISCWMSESSASN